MVRLHIQKFKLHIQKIDSYCKLNARAYDKWQTDDYHAWTDKRMERLF